MRGDFRETLTLAVALYAMPIALAAQSSQLITVEYDRFSNVTSVTTARDTLDYETEVAAYYVYPGERQRAPVPKLVLHVARSGSDWSYLEFNTAYFLLDDRTRIALPLGEHHSDVGSGYVLEQFFITVPRAMALRIARAHRVEMRIGVTEFTWKDSFQGAFRRLVSFASASTTPTPVFLGPTTPKAPVLTEPPADSAPPPVSSPRAPAAGAYFEFQVRSPAVPLAPSEGPTYPAMLHSAGVEGRVLAQFVVDSTGTPQMGTFKILESSHELFSQAVREHVASLRYRPAVLDDGRPVAQIVQQPFTFSIGK